MYTVVSGRDAAVRRAADVLDTGTDRRGQGEGTAGARFQQFLFTKSSLWTDQCRVFD